MGLFEKVQGALEDLQKRKPYKGRYIDIEATNNISPFVNWRRILNLE